MTFEEEEDDGIPAELDPVIDDVPPAAVTAQASNDSGMKPVEVPKTHMSHHVEFAAAVAPHPSTQAPLSVAPDWFTSLGAGEPPFTTFTPKHQGCCDYIWYTPGPLLLSGVLCLPPRDCLEGYLPSRDFPSDHLAVMSEFRFEPSCLSTDW